MVTLFRGSRPAHRICSPLGLVVALTLLGACPAQSDPDSVLVYGPTKFTKPTSAPIGFGDFFGATLVPGRRYLLEIANGTPTNKRVTSARVSVNGQEWLGLSEFGSTVESAIRRITTVQTSEENYLSLILTGSTGSFVSIRIVHVRDSSYAVFGPVTYERPAVVDTQTTVFSIPGRPAATAPYRMYVINGDEEGGNRVTNATVTLNSQTLLGPSNFGTGIATLTRTVTLNQQDTLSIYNQSASGTLLSVEFAATDSLPPVLQLASPPESLVTTQNSVQAVGAVLDSTYVTLNIDGQPHTLGADGSFTKSVTLSADGVKSIPVVAMDAAGWVTDSTLIVIRDTQPPHLIVTVPGMEMDSTETDSVLLIQGSWKDTTYTQVYIDGDQVGYAKADTIMNYLYPLDIGVNRIRFLAVDRAGHKTAFIRMFLRKPGVEPEAPTVDPDELAETEVTAFYDAAKFLFTGESPIQVGVSQGTILPDRASVIRGRVLSRDYGPMPNVTVSVLGHPEFGSTTSRDDGGFDLAVNGGRQYTLRFTKVRYLEGQRKIYVVPNDFSILDDLALIGVTARYTDIDLDDPVVARSRFASDANGDRDLRLIFRPGTRARVVRDVGDTVTYSHIRLRATEYTVGADGPESMPGELPPSSAYTYCVDLRTDEATHLADSMEVSTLTTLLTDTASCYVSNFLHYPVGAHIPLGFYEHATGRWVTEPDGVVLRIVDTTGTSLLIDSDGDSLPDSQGRRDSLGITTTELEQLRTQFAIGDTVWRLQLTHFSAPDANVILAGLTGALSTFGERARLALVNLISPCLGKGSIIECENGVLRERIPLAGTPYSLNYRSARAPGYAAARTLHLSLFSESPPSDLVKVIVRLDVAGQRIERADTNPQLGDTMTIVWDGKDGYGRPVAGSVYGRLGIGYQYRMFVQASGGGRSFGDPISAFGDPRYGTGDRTEGLVSWKYQQVVLGAADAGSAGLGGWTLSPHHFFDPKGKGILYYGDGAVLSGESFPATIRHHGGANGLYANGIPCGIPAFGQPPCASDGAESKTVSLYIGALARGPEGDLYLGENVTGSIYRLGSDDVLHRIGGTGTPGDFDTTAGLARTKPLRNIRDLAVGSDGTVYFMLNDDGTHPANCVVGRITPDSTMVKIITGSLYSDGTGDGGPVGAATIGNPEAIAIGPDGSLFIAHLVISTNRYRIRRVTPDGYITNYAGNGAQTEGFTGRATDGKLATIPDMVVDGGGTLYLIDNTRVRSITPDGLIRTLITAAQYGPISVALAPEGGVYLIGDGRVYQLDPDGTLSSIAGGGASPWVEGGPAQGVDLYNNALLVANDDGSYFMTTKSGPHPDRILRVGRGLASLVGDEYVIPTQDGSELYVFSRSGRHLRTKDALTGAIRYSFRYESGRLVSIVDVNGDSTVIARNGSSGSITGPFGQATGFSLSGDYLASVTFNNESYTLTSSPNPVLSGMLVGLSDPLSNAHEYEYDVDTGRLTRDTDPEDNYQSLPEPDGSGQTRTSELVSAEGRSTEYEITSRYDGTQRRKVTDPRGVSSLVTDSSSVRIRYLWTPEGLSRQTTLGADPRLGVVATFDSRVVDLLPGGETRTTETSRFYDPPDFDPPEVNGTWAEETRINGGPPLRREFVRNGGASDTFTVTSPEGRVMSTVVDDRGHPIATVIPGLAPLEITRDAHGRPTLLQQGDRGYRYHYDVRRRLDLVRDTLGRMTQFHYNDSDRLTRQTLPDGREVAMSYDAAGNLITVTPPNDETHAFAYTRTGLNKRYTPPGVAGLDSVASTYDFNRDRQLTRITRPGGSVVSLAYGQSSGLLDSVSVERGTSVLFYSPSTGQLDSLRSPDAVTVSYDYTGPLPDREQWSGAMPGGVTQSVTIVRNPQFRDSIVTVSGTTPVTFEYDHDGLLERAGPLDIHRRTDNGFIDSTHVEDGGGAIESSSDYDQNGGLANLRYRHSAQGVLFQQSISRDALGRITGVFEQAFGTSRTWGYRYDLAGRLYGVTLDNDTTATYRYDANGNRQSVITFEGGVPADTVTATYDEQDRLLSSGEVEFDYTPSGELYRKRASGDTTVYRYDALGNLLSVRFQSGDSVSYVVDGVNRRVGRRWNGQWTGGWIYANALQPVAELDSTGAVVNRHVYGADGHTPSLLVRSGSTHRLIVDYLGTVRGVVDVESGGASQNLDVDAWGLPITSTNAWLQSLGFGGGLVDTSTEFVRFGVRDYNPGVGRWAAKDPIGLNARSTNFYTYADNTPVNLVDPSGLVSIDCVQRVLDGLGFIDITGLADGLNALLYIAQGRPYDAGISVLALVPLPAFDALKGLRYSDDAAALIDLAKQAERAGGVTAAEAEILKGWAREYKVTPVRGPEIHPQRRTVNWPHIRIGPVRHIPVK